MAYASGVLSIIQKRVELLKQKYQHYQRITVIVIIIIIISIAFAIRDPEG